MNKKKETDFKNNQNLSTSATEKNSLIKEKQQQLPPGKDEKWWGE